MNRVVFLLALVLLGLFPSMVEAAAPSADLPAFPPPLSSYGDNSSMGLWTVLVNRVQAEPFNLIATIIFLLAIVHTFLAPKILKLSHRIQHRHEEERRKEREKTGVHDDGPDPFHQSVPAAMLHFLGEVEAVFGLWVIPLAVAITLVKGSAVMRTYIDQTVTYTEPLFVVVIMAIAASRPVVQAAVRVLRLVAGDSPTRWWFVLLTIGPLLGSFITEPAAMTICAVLLGREFYRLAPSNRFMYATLGLLFVNVSVGGALTNFAAPPVLMVAAKWNWSSYYMFTQFGDRAIGGIIVSNIVYYLIFRKEFVQMSRVDRKLPEHESENEDTVPLWITAVHVFFLAWTVFFAHEPALFIGGFLFFIGFTMATTAYQDEMNMKSPMLVGFFLAGLVVHGGLQGWWIEPVLSRLGEYPLLIGATILTAFNDNAAITYLATLVPNFEDHLKDAVVSGAICGGGLTVIANAPNPAGQSILQKFFPGGMIAPGGLFLAALGPTVVMMIFFAIPR
jgi:hypothetical protein